MIAMPMYIPVIHSKVDGFRVVLSSRDVVRFRPDATAVHTSSDDTAHEANSSD